MNPGTGMNGGEARKGMVEQKCIRYVQWPGRPAHFY